MRGRKGFTLIEIMLVVAIIGLLIGIAELAYLRAREVARARVRQMNLYKIDGAKEEYAFGRGHLRIAKRRQHGCRTPKRNLGAAGAAASILPWPLSNCGGRLAMAIGGFDCSWKGGKRGGGVEGGLIVVVNEHGDEVQFVVAFAEALGQRKKAPHALDLKLIAVAQ